MTDFCDMCECEVVKITQHLGKNIQICQKCETEIKNMESEKE